MSFILTLFVWLIEFLLVAAVVLAIGLVIYARWNYGSLESLGIPVIKPHFFMGSNYNAHNVFPHLEDLERSKQYGHVYGVYDGRTPTVFVSDLEILRLILSRDFDHFRNHRTFLDEHPVTSEVLDFLDDEKWKTVRAMLTPHFTTGKIKSMSETVCELSEEYVAALIKDCDGEKTIKMDFRTYSPPLIFELIGKIFCGINIENARDPNNEFIQTMKVALGIDFFTFDWTFTLANVFPFAQRFAPVFSKSAMDTFSDTIKGILKGREDSQVQKPDMVNTLLQIVKRARSDSDFKRLGITENTALGQAFEFFVASYEGIRSTLTLFLYYLATHPEIHEKLLEEIDASLKKHNQKINYDSVADLPYLTACLSETLRLSPGFFRTDRRCTKDWEHNGIKIKKDMIVVVPLWAVHRNQEQFPDPETFDPERFMPGRKENIDPYAFGVFGNGPRACIGQRFVYEMMKIIVCNYMKEFTIKKRPDTVFNCIKGSPLFLKHDPIYVDLVRRN